MKDYEAGQLDYLGTCKWDRMPRWQKVCTVLFLLSILAQSIPVLGGPGWTLCVSMPGLVIFGFLSGILQEVFSKSK